MWYLKSFSAKTHSVCVNLEVLRKLYKKLRCFPGKFTQLAQILHDRRSWRSRQISTLFWICKIEKVLDMQYQRNFWYAKMTKFWLCNIKKILDMQYWRSFGYAILKKFWVCNIRKILSMQYRSIFKVARLSEDHKHARMIAQAVSNVGRGRCHVLIWVQKLYFFVESRVCKTNFMIGNINSLVWIFWLLF